MKRKAILYTRVSTDEQNNGYSPSDQKDKLYRYCENNNIEVVGFYHDDESGKSFDRPEWIKIMKFIKKNRGQVDNIIFLKWDRFSRNVAEAYIAIRDLKMLGVEAQSIEQPLDFEIPESKIMLAIYLAAPEVDNDRRTLNVFHGIRRAKKEGRWLGNCLRGYKNTRDENNRPIIAPEGGEQQRLVQKAFKEFATGFFHIEEVRRMLQKEGLKCNRNSFWMLLRNKGYIGKVFVPAYKDEPAHWVDGIHEPLIDKATFYAVQDIIEGRKRNLPDKYKTMRDEMPLRGYLICPKCGKTMTGSSSRGKLGTLYFYYHCDRTCKERQRAEVVNENFVNWLEDFRAKPNAMHTYAMVLKHKLKEGITFDKTELEKLGKDIEKQKLRLKNAKDLMLDGELSASEYKEMKAEVEEKINLLCAEIERGKEGLDNPVEKVNDCLELLLTLAKYYKSGGTATKQLIAGSIFPGKIIFGPEESRTPQINQVVPLLCSRDGRFGGSKKRKHAKNSVLSLGVRAEGLEPTCLAAPDPKSGASANFATPAFKKQK